MGQQPATDTQLEKLYDYTKFHIGIYITLSAAIIGVFANDTLAGAYAALQHYALWSLGLFMIAGLAGGIVAANACTETSYGDYIKKWVGPFGLPIMTVNLWTYVEHIAFWAGCGAALLGLLKAPACVA